MSKHIFSQRERLHHIVHNRIPIDSEACPHCHSISLTKEFTSGEGLLQIDCWVEGCDREWAVMLPADEKPEY